MDLLRQTEQLRRELGDDTALAKSFRVRALLLVRLGRAAEALPLVDEAHQLAVKRDLTELAAELKPLRQVLRRTA